MSVSVAGKTIDTIDGHVRVLTAEVVKGHYWLEPVKITIPAFSTDQIDVDVSWPFAVEVLQGTINANLLIDGDKISAKAMVGIVGVLTVAADVGATVLTMNDPVYLDLGYYVTFGSGTERYLIISKDAEAKTITLNTPLTAAVAGGATVKSEVEFIHGFLEVNQGVEYVIGEAASGGSYLPANVPLRISVQPLSGAARHLRGFMEVLY